MVASATARCRVSCEGLTSSSNMSAPTRRRRSDVGSCLTALRFLPCYLCSVRMQNAHAINSTKPGRRQERRKAVFISSLNLGAAGYEERDAVAVILCRGQVQRRVELKIRPIRIRPGCTQHLDRRCVSRASRSVVSPAPESETGLAGHPC